MVSPTFNLLSWVFNDCSSADTKNDVINFVLVINVRELRCQLA